ncbi:response regulator [Zhouia amylolytica]|uniref:response regulator n=1 Tax=Zhouia amylolytica TaxID=376730 RepID=UPI0020CFE2B6|nr:response regulator [Zhouia amylolytica]MCQ0112001.1 response regulator transcription factor [Zhouia amylolytica]
MFRKVLIAEDIDSINLGIVTNLKKSFDFEIAHVKYCDDAILKVKKALLEALPYDLLITDLSFKPDHRNCNICSGDELAREVLKLHPPTKIIMYSIEDRPLKIKNFFNEPGIHGYVCKGRESAREINKAIETVYKNEYYLSQSLDYAIKGTPVMEIDDYDIRLINELANGLLQDEIAKKFKAEGVFPASLSSIEKRLNKLKIYFKAKNSTHLVAIVKDLGLI